MLLHDLYAADSDGDSGVSGRELQAYRESYHKLAGRTDLLLGASHRCGEPQQHEAVAEALGSCFVDDYREQWRWVDIRLKAMQHIRPRIEAMAAAHRCRLAHPFFDADMISMSFAMPSSFRVDGSRDKPLLKDLVARDLPLELVERRKEGMGVPTSAWFSLGLRPLVWRWLSRRRLARSGVLQVDAVRALVAGDLKPRDARRRRWGDLLWQLCVLQAWVEDIRV